MCIKIAMATHGSNGGCLAVKSPGDAFLWQQCFLTISHLAGIQVTYVAGRQTSPRLLLMDRVTPVALPQTCARDNEFQHESAKCDAAPQPLTAYLDSAATVRPWQCSKFRTTTPHTNKQTNKHTSKQTNRHTHTHKHTHIHTRAHTHARACVHTHTHTHFMTIASTPCANVCARSTESGTPSSKSLGTA